MTIAKVTVKSQMAKHVKLGQANERLGLDIHVAACEDLLHAATHGDVSLCQHLYESLGGKGTSAARTASLKAWFVTMSGKQITAEKGTWKLVPKWTKEKFLMERAETEPYFIDGEKELPVLSLDKILGMLAGYVKKVDKAVEADRFNGDAEATKAILSGVVDFATERAKRLTAIQTGAVTNQADKIIKEGVVVETPAALASARKQTRRLGVPIIKPKPTPEKDDLKSETKKVA